jgi:hypothetical protein
LFNKIDLVKANLILGDHDIEGRKSVSPKVLEAAQLFKSNELLLKNSPEFSWAIGYANKILNVEVKPSVNFKIPSDPEKNVKVTPTSTKAKVTTHKSNSAVDVKIVKTMASQGVHGGVSGTYERQKEKNYYIKKDPKPIRLEGKWDYRKRSFELEQKVARSFDISAYVASQFTEGKDLTKSLSQYAIHGQGKSPGVYGKVSRVVDYHRSMYEGYLQSLGKLLENPRIPVNSEADSGKVARVVSVPILRNPVLYASVSVSWDPLRKQTLEEKRAIGGNALSFWYHSGKLARAYSSELKKHDKSISYGDFYDRDKLMNTLSSLTAKADSVRTRVVPFRFSIDLTIPKWRAAEGQLMDSLITQPYIEVDKAQSTRVSSFFNTLKKNRDYFAKFESKKKKFTSR